MKGCRFYPGQNYGEKYSLLIGQKFSNIIILIKVNFLSIFLGCFFLHPNEVEERFQNYLQSISLIKDERINKFIKYIFKTYITKYARYLPNLWVEFAPTTNRTTNNCEAFHSKLINLFIAR